MNPIAAFGTESGDYLDWVLTTTGDANSNGPYQPTLRQQYGFAFDVTQNKERDRWSIVDFTPNDARVSLLIEDFNPEPENKNPPQPYTLSVRLFTTPGPGTDELFLSQIEEPFGEVINGTGD